MNQFDNENDLEEKELLQKIRTLNPIFTEEILNLMYDFIMTKFSNGLERISHNEENYSSEELLINSKKWFEKIFN